jgi:hypothetical protein
MGSCTRGWIHGGVSTVRASSHRRGVALMAQQVAPSSGGVPGPTRGEGRATGRAIIGGNQKGKIGEFDGGWLASRGRAPVGWPMARKVLIGVHSRAKWATAGACTWARSVLYAGRTRVRAAVEQGRARLATGGVSVKETRSCTACLLRLSRRTRWRVAERRRPRGDGACGRGGIGCTRTLCTPKRKLLAAQRLCGPNVVMRVLSEHWCPSEMLHRDGHRVKELCQVAAAQAAHAHAVEQLDATEAHARPVAGDVVLRPLSARLLSGASVVASSSAVAAVCDRRPVSRSGRCAPKQQVWGSMLRGGGQGARGRRCAGGEDRSGWAGPEAGVAVRARITVGELRERGRV